MHPESDSQSQIVHALQDLTRVMAAQVVVLRDIRDDLRARDTGNPLDQIEAILRQGGEVVEQMLGESPPPRPSPSPAGSTSAGWQEAAQRINYGPLYPDKPAQYDPTGDLHAVQFPSREEPDPPPAKPAHIDSTLDHKNGNSDATGQGREVILGTMRLADNSMVQYVVSGQVNHHTLYPSPIPEFDQYFVDGQTGERIYAGLKSNPDTGTPSVPEFTSYESGGDDTFMDSQGVRHPAPGAGPRQQGRHYALDGAAEDYEPLPADQAWRLR